MRPSLRCRLRAASPPRALFVSCGQLQASCFLLTLWAALRGRGGRSVLWTICAILLILWLLGWGFHVAGALIHLLLVLVVAIVVLSLLTRRRIA